MARLERLLIPIVLAVMIGAFLLEGLTPATVRRIALSVGGLLAIVLLFGMYRRVHKKLREGKAAPPAGQTSNDGPAADGPR